MSELITYSDDTSVDIRRYIRFAKDGVPGAVIGLIVGVVLAGSYLLLTPKTYTATETVTVNPITTTPFNTGRSAADLISPSTEANLATSAAVMELAVKGTGTARDAEELRNNTTATPVDRSTILKISSSAPSAKEARSQAHAVAKAYLSYRVQQADSRKSAILAGVDRSITDLKTRLQAETSANAADSRTIDDLNAEIWRLSQTRTELDGMDTLGGAVITPASAAPAYARPTARPALAAGVLGGPTLGLLIGGSIRAARRRIREYDEATSQRGVDVSVELTEQRGALPARHEDMEALRVMRERFITLQGTGIPPAYCLVDDTELRDQVDVPTAFALVLAQRHGRIDMILPGVDGEDKADVVEMLRLAADGTGHGYISDLFPELTVTIFPTDPSLHEIDTYLTSSVDSHLRNRMASSYPVLLVARSDWPAASLLSTVRLFATLVVVKEAGRALSGDLATLVSDVSADTGRAVGSILVPAGRHVEAPPLPDDQLATKDETSGVPVTDDGSFLAELDPADTWPRASFSP